MDTNTRPRTEALTREALGAHYLPPKAPPQGDGDQDYAKWERIRRIVSTALVSVVVVGLWALGIVAAVRPII